MYVCPVYDRRRWLAGLWTARWEFASYSSQRNYTGIRGDNIGAETARDPDNARSEIASARLSGLGHSQSKSFPGCYACRSFLSDPSPLGWPNRIYNRGRDRRRNES